LEFENLFQAFGQTNLVRWNFDFLWCNSSRLRQEISDEGKNMIWWFLILIIVSSLWVLSFYFKSKKPEILDANQSNIELSKNKLLELETDFTNGNISKEDFDKSKVEIEEALSLDLEEINEWKNRDTKSDFIVYFSLIFLGLFSLTIYQTLAPDFVPKSNEISKTPTLEESEQKLRQFLQDNPNDDESWRVLGLTLFEQGKIAESISAYEKAYEIDSENINTLIELASAIATFQENDFRGRPAQLIDKALKINPNSPDALYVAGLIAVNGGQFELAKSTWEMALNALPANHQDRQILIDILKELDSIVSGKEIPSTSISVEIDFSKEVLETRGKDFLMVYVKSVNGPPMPVAIQKIKLKDYKGRLVLTKDNEVMPSMPLSSLNEGLVVVRLSKSGNAIRQKDDYEVVSDPINVQYSPLVKFKVE
jgi:cytochrome c-type biogenesis protein CcmH